MFMFFGWDDRLLKSVLPLERKGGDARASIFQGRVAAELVRKRAIKFGRSHGYRNVVADADIRDTIFYRTEK